MRITTLSQGVAFVVAVLVGSTCSPADAQPAPAGSELSRAIRDGETARVATLLRGGANVNARDAEGNTPLILASLYSGAECVELLLENGADVNAANKAGATALVRAATDAKKVRLLLDAGGDARAKTSLGNDALILAARKPGNAAAVKMLLEHGADARLRNEGGVSAIQTAAAAGDLESVRLLLDKGVDPNDFPREIKGHPLLTGGRTPLMWAAFRNDVPMMRLLVERGADPNRPAVFGTPLSQAAWHDNVEAAAFLLDHGATVDARDAFEFTPLHWAAVTESSRTDLVKLLLARGADVNAAGGDPVDAFEAVPQTPLMLAMKRGKTPVVEALLAAGAKGADTAQARPALATRVLPEQIGQQTLRAAAERGLARLQETAAKTPAVFVQHASKQTCVSCHQQYLPMVAVGNARRRGLRLDDNAAREQVALVHRIAEDPASIFDFREYVVEAIFHPDGIFTRGYGLFAFAAENVPADAATDAMVHHLATMQAADGHWMMNLQRPPIQSGDIAATALAIQALKHYGWAGRQGEFAEAIDRGRQWLKAAKPESHDESVYQMLGLYWAGESPEKTAGLARALIGRQREDGGWAQLPTLATDAYATGQALYTLTLAAKLPVSDPAWQRGLRYLLATQHDDGTWYALRRAFPFQPTMSSGFAYGRDAWISAAATSWAVIAMTQAIEPGAAAGARIESKQGGTEAIATRPPAAAAPVDFVKQVKPILERSCVDCHGPQRARAHYRLDSREALLKGGDSGNAAAVPGHGDKSPLIQYVSGPGADLEMPPKAKRHLYQALSAEEVRLLRNWIDQDAAWPKDATLVIR